VNFVYFVPRQRLGMSIGRLQPPFMHKNEAAALSIGVPSMEVDNEKTKRF
jgi:hypothetical protein